jgi:hypothetical protein
MMMRQSSLHYSAQVFDQQQLVVAFDAAFKQQTAVGMPVSPLEMPILANRQPNFFVAAL